MEPFEQETKQPQLLDKPLKQDQLDILLQQEKAYSHELTGTAMALIAGVSAVVEATSGNASYGLTTAFMITGGIEMAYALPKLIQEFTSLQNLEKKHSIQDTELGIFAQRMVYKGKEPLNARNKEFERGTNFYYIQLPPFPSRIDNKAPTTEETNFGIDLYEYAFRKIKEETKGKDYDFVAIDVGKPGLPFVHDTKKREDAFQGKDQDLKEPGHLLAILTREEFESLSISPYEAFEKAIEKMDDAQVTDIWKELRKTSDPDEKNHAKSLVLKRIDQILERQVAERFNSTPDIVRERVGPNFDPVKVKHHPLSQIRRTENGFFFVKVNTSNGEMKWIPLDRLLQTTNQPIEAILSNNSSFQKAQLAFVVSQMLTEINVDDLIRKRAITHDELVLKKTDLKISTNSEIESISRTGIGRPKSVIKAGLTALTLFTAIQGGKTLIENQQTAEIANKPNTSTPTEQSVRQSGVPTAGLEWKIDGTLNPEGYYINGTSHEFTNGIWKIEKDETEELDLPTSFDTKNHPNFLTLAKTLPIHPIYENAIRIPIKNGTELSALKVVGPNNNEVRYKVVKMEDGSVELRLGGIVNVVSSAEVTAYFTPTDKPQIHATENLPAIPLKDLSKEAANTVTNAIQTLDANNAKPEDISNALFDAVRKDHRYSVSNEANEKLAEAKTGAQLINLVADLPAASCEVANSEAILMTSPISGIPAVNMAYGFHVSEHHPAGSIGNFLKREAGHAFAVDANGVILDATPDVDPNRIDEQTQKYLNLLKGTDQTSNTQTDPWTQELQKIVQEAEEQKGFADKLKIFAGLATGAAGVFVARQASKLLERFTRDKNISVSQVAENMFLGAFSEKDLQKARDIFSWISYADADSNVHVNEINDNVSKNKILDTIKNSVNYERLEHYFENPKELNTIMKKRGIELSQVEEVKLKLLAQHVLTH